MKDSKLFFYSLIGLIFLILTFFLNWIFIIPAAILSGMGWKRMFKKP